MTWQKGQTLVSRVYNSDFVTRNFAQLLPGILTLGEPRWQQAVGQRSGHGLASALRTRTSGDKEYHARCKRSLIVITISTRS
ncbi:hypothetical protein ACH79_16085 [Bradyrhizobium sp. CCBAU 051011]|nr:hypothetical protein ACH79_16085 [Bradyrhizobium sp. CCBAU 051011]